MSAEEVCQKLPQANPIMVPMIQSVIPTAHLNNAAPTSLHMGIAIKSNGHQFSLTFYMTVIASPEITGLSF